MMKCFQEKWRNCVSSDFRHEIDKNALVWVYCAAGSRNFVPTFRGNLSVPSSWVKNSKKDSGFLTPEDGASRTCRNISNYHYSLCNKPRKPQLSKREVVNILDRREFSDLVKWRVRHKMTAVIGRQSSISFHLSLLKILKTVPCTGFVYKH